MRDSASVISQAVKGIDIDDLAHAMDVSPARMYEILSTSCPYPRTKELIRRIGSFSSKGARLIKADLDAMFADILQTGDEDFTAIELHREAFEAVQACLTDKCRADRKRELRELITVAQTMLENIDKPTNNLREFARKAVNRRAG